MAWKQRVLWTLISLLGMYAASALATRRFRAEINGIKRDIEIKNALIVEMVKSVKAGLEINAHS